MTCVHFDGAQICMQVSEGFHRLRPPKANRLKLASVLLFFVRARVQRCTEMAFLLLALNLRLLASPFCRPDHKFVFASSHLTCDSVWPGLKKNVAFDINEKHSVNLYLHFLRAKFTHKGYSNFGYRMLFTYES